MWMDVVLGGLALISSGLALWQWVEGRLFPLHSRGPILPPFPPVSVLKPLKGNPAGLSECLRSWFAQDYGGEVQLLFGVASSADPAIPVVQALLDEFPKARAELIICPERFGTNGKVSTLIQLQRLIKHEIVVISDADVKVGTDLLQNLLAPFGRAQVGMVHCLYRLANPATLAMQWEAIAINADFWSQVLQARRTQPLDFALGAVMAVRRSSLETIGGFPALLDFLADDYQLGHRVSALGQKIEFCSVPVDCIEPRRSWVGVWRHQLRWARTIRVCNPAGYFLSLLHNGTLWPALWMLISPSALVATVAGGAILVRTLQAISLQQTLIGHAGCHRYFWLVPLKDFLQAVLWVCAFVGNKIVWQGEKYRVRRGGKLVRL